MPAAGARRELDAHRHRAALREFNGVVDQVRDDLAEAEVVADDRFVCALGYIDNECEPFLRGAQFEEPAGIVNGFRNQKRLRVELYRTGLEPREVEQIAERTEKAAAGAHQVGDHVLLAGVEAGVAKHLGHAHDARHGRAQLVAHFRKEIGARPGRVIGALAFGIQMLKQGRDGDQRGERRRGNGDDIGNPADGRHIENDRIDRETQNAA